MPFLDLEEIASERLRRLIGIQEIIFPLGLVDSCFWDPGGKGREKWAQVARKVAPGQVIYSLFNSLRTGVAPLGKITVSEWMKYYMTV